MMSLLVLNLPDNMAGNRMLSKKAAATYCRIPVNKFSAICPVAPIDLGTGLSYDVRDLDKWIDSYKQNSHDFSDDAIVKLLEKS